MPVLLCGTPKLGPGAVQGKRTFNQYCAACHKLDARSQGPVLRHVKPELFWAYLDTVRHQNDSLKFERLDVDFHRNLSEQVLSSSDVRNIMDYIK
ncbi:c-type cytochrome [Flavobacterium sp. SE-s28]|uniref:C-type cytochrome n=2 Tax=Flavobacterium silvaticum TaxID=1852020 RepID=A0A972JH06_9FLAO|nr:c-type cytochrome [Flavobacterium silvaticum]